MAPEPSGVRIAVNVMRARLTIVGFNLAIVTFQLNAIRNFAGGVEVASSNEVVHFAADTALLVAVALSITAAVLFISAAALDPVGVVDHPAVVAGDVCMYLSLAQSVAGFFSPIVATLRATVAALDTAPVAGELLLGGVATFGGIAWFSAFYVGPVVSLVRSPFRARTTWTLAVVYVVLAATLLNLDLLARTIEGAVVMSFRDAATSAFQPMTW